MEELIKVNTSEGGKKTVSARELYIFLGVKEQFADWVQRKINDYDFTKDIDFRSFTEKSEKGGRPRIEYEITIEMAKELSMLENNEQGKKARKYFIQCEKQLKENFIPIGASKELKAIFMIDEKQQQLEKKVDTVSKDFTDYKENSPLFNIECEELQKALKKKGTEILGGKLSLAYKDKSLRTKLYADIQREIKRQFQVSSYKGIKRQYFEKALEIIEKYTVPLAIKDEIGRTNNQVSFEKVI